MTIFCCVFSGVTLLAGGPRAAAQYLPQPPPPPEEPAPDPFHAGKSVEIGQYYLKKGNYFAAIDRFMEAIRYQPKLALPRRLIAETYEKVKDKSSALDWYRKYLEALPHAEDADKVRRRIEVLTRELEKKKSRGKSQ